MQLKFMILCASILSVAVFIILFIIIKIKKVIPGEDIEYINKPIKKQIKDPLENTINMFDDYQTIYTVGSKVCIYVSRYPAGSNNPSIDVQTINKLRGKGYKKIIMTNGANKNIDKDGGGTTGAIAQLSYNLFQNQEQLFRIDGGPVFQQTKSKIGSIQMDKITNRVISDDLYDGSVFFTNINDLFVYHIKGKDFSDGSVENDGWGKIVENYYNQIFLHQLKMSVGHKKYYLLTMVPGNNFKGGVITRQAFIKTVCKNFQDIRGADQVTIGKIKNFDLLPVFETTINVVADNDLFDKINGQISKILKV